AGAGPENDHTALFQMAHRTAANVVFANLVDAQRRHDTGISAETFERVLHRERIDHRSQHAHMVGGDSIHTGTGEPCTAKNVAAAEHHRDLHAPLRKGPDFNRDTFEDLWID